MLQLRPIVFVLILMVTSTSVFSVEQNPGADAKSIPSATKMDPALDEVILQSLEGYTIGEGEQPLRYYANRYDLNGDGKDEVFVYLVGAFTCGTGGCSSLLFQTSEAGYNVVSELSLINPPVF